MSDSRPHDHEERIRRVRQSLDGLSVGDSFGQRFFSPGVAETHIGSSTLPPPIWKYTDDTEMALAIGEVLEEAGQIDQDALAQNFARRYVSDPHRGYGAGAHDILQEIGGGGDWRTVAAAAFRGQGSKGNGGAMRVAPVGAYFADDFQTAANEAGKSAAVTHAHPEGQAGAIAVAVAVAWAWQWREQDGHTLPMEMLKTALRFTPPGETANRIARAATLELDAWEFTAAECLGNGGSLTAADTVPFCLWCAAAHLDDFPAAMWATVRVGGDIDTNAAIVGGIVAMANESQVIPDIWLRSRESLWYSSK